MVVLNSVVLQSTVNAVFGCQSCPAVALEGVTGDFSIPAIAEPESRRRMTGLVFHECVALTAGHLVGIVETERTIAFFKAVSITGKYFHLGCYSQYHETVRIHSGTVLFEGIFVGMVKQQESPPNWCQVVRDCRASVKNGRNNPPHCL